MNSNRKIRYFSNNDGMALVLVIVFSGLLIVLGCAAVTFAFNEKLTAGYHSEDIAKYYIAEAGIEAGFAALQNDFYFDQQITGFLNNGSFLVSFSDEESSRIIISEGTIGEYTLVLQVVVKNNPDQGAYIAEWIRP